jgi:predicted nucleotidyltransferase
MASEQSVIKLAEKFAREIKREGIHLRKAILFGSHAKKTSHKNSDIDIALVADEFAGFVFNDLNFFIKTIIKKPYLRIQVQTFSTKYFKKGDPFIDEIKRTGIEINCNI